MKKNYFIIAFLILMNNCSKNENPITPNNNSQFGIYFLQDSTIKIYQISDQDLSKLKLQTEPWLSDHDIRYYDFSSHCIYLREEKNKLFPIFSYELTNYPNSWIDRPFVVVANKEKCTLGYFTIEHSVEPYLFPKIFFLENKIIYPKDIIFYDWAWLYLDDPRNNEIIKNALIQGGIYHEGISVTFDTTNAIKFIDNGDTATIEYTFTITNNDQENLYVFDPDLVDVEHFHYYINGPTFKNLENDQVYYSNYKKTKELYIDWTNSFLQFFTKLNNNQSIQRTVRLKGYTHFTTGEYIFEWRYSGPIIGLEKNFRELADGRIWIGPTKSNMLIMVVNDESSLKLKWVQNSENITRLLFE